MMKATLNTAKKLNLHLEVVVMDVGKSNVTSVEIYGIDNDEAWEEYLVSYQINSNGSLSYQGTCFPGDHDLPGHIANEKALRGLLPEFARFAASLT